MNTGDHTEEIEATPEPSALDDPRVVDALEEYLAGLESGRRPNRRDFLARHAEIAAALESCLAGLDVIYQAGNGPASGSSSDVSNNLGMLAPGSRLGDFRICRVAGRGGMGIVYEAEQISLGRRVALKVLPFAATLNPRQLQRFKHEAQAAALLHHTHIVPIHFIGCERGVHFFAMQFIDGPSLAAVIAELRGAPDANVAGPNHSPRGQEHEKSRTVVALAQEGKAAAALPSVVATLPPASGIGTSGIRCVETVARAGLSTERAERGPEHFHSVARLGMQVAEALQHAHETGIVHRDIKPGNLLLDAHSHVWITDFGLAQIQGEPQLTGTGDIIGTLRYMSPEQALGRRDQVDRRADVYSLGATLYELLTLEPPFTGDNHHYLLRRLACDEPRPPRRIKRDIPSELEIIVLKALAKEPAERYAGAGELADDLRRFLQDQPIQARRPTLRQRTSRWLRRHKLMVRAAAVMAVVGIAGLMWALAVIWRSEKETAEALAKAQRLQTLAEAAVNEIYTAQKWLEQEPLADPVQTRLLHKFLAYFKAFAQENGDDPKLQRQTATVRTKTGQILHALGRYPEAEAEFKAAHEIFTSLVAASPDDRSLVNDLASTHNNLAAVLTKTNRVAEAMEHLRQARDLAAPLVLTADVRPEWLEKLIDYHSNLGILLRNAGRFPEAEKELERGAELSAALLARDPKRLESIYVRANILRARGVLSWSMSQKQQAGKAWDEALSLARELCVREPRRPAFRDLLLHCQNYLASMHSAAGQWQKSEELLRENLALRRRLIDDFPDRVDYRFQLAVTYYNLGMAQRQLPDQEKSYRKAIELLKPLTISHPNVGDFQVHLARTQNNLGNLLRRANRVREAEAAFREALSLLENLPRDLRQQPGNRDDFCLMLHNVGYIAWQLGRPAEGEPLISRAIQLRQELVNDFPRIPVYRETLAGMHMNRAWLRKTNGKAAEAEPDFRAGIRNIEELLAHAQHNGPWQRSVATAQNHLARLLWSQGRQTEATEAFRAAETRWRLAVTLDKGDVAVTLQLARFLADCPDPAVAAPSEGIALASPICADNKTRDANSLLTLGLCLYRAGEYRPAVATLDRAVSQDVDNECLRGFLLAMSHASLGQQGLARTFYQNAVAALTNHWRNDDELDGFRRAAEALLEK